jgi:hypothetical protein
MLKEAHVSRLEQLAAFGLDGGELRSGRSHNAISSSTFATMRCCRTFLAVMVHLFEPNVSCGTEMPFAQILSQ